MPFDRTVNYLGHAALAREERADPLFVIGAMLPDMASMLRSRLPMLEEPLLVAGIRFHERTDAVFHALPTFVELNRAALEQLRALGVSRGPARAAAHLGTEFAIDAFLAHDQQVAESYLAALDVGAHSPPDLWSPWEVASTLRLRELLRHLRSSGVALHDVSRERFVNRFAFALGDRPRLAPTATELEDMARVCERHAETVAERMLTLLDELRRGLFST